MNLTVMSVTSDKLVNTRRVGMCPRCAVAYALRHPPETPKGTVLLGKLIAAMRTQTFIAF